MNNELNNRSITVTVGDGVLSVDGARESIRAEVSYPVRVLSVSPERSTSRRIMTPPSTDVSAVFAEEEDKDEYESQAATYTIDANDNNPLPPPLNEVSLITLMDQTDGTFGDEIFTQQFSQSRARDSDSESVMHVADEIDLPLPPIMTPSMLSSECQVDKKSYVLSSDPEVIARIPHISYTDPNTSDVTLPISGNPLDHLRNEHAMDPLTHIKKLVADIKSMGATDPDIKSNTSTVMVGDGTLTDVGEQVEIHPRILTPSPSPDVYEVHASPDTVRSVNFISQYDTEYSIVCEEAKEEKSPPVRRQVEDIVRGDVCSVQTTDTPRSRLTEIPRPVVLIETLDESFVKPTVSDNTASATVATQTNKFTHFVVPKSSVPFFNHPPSKRATIDSTVSSIRTNPIVEHMFATPTSQPVTVTTFPTTASSTSTLSNEIRETDSKTCFIVVLIISSAGLALFILGILGKLS
eukprot:TRINITY_DN2198_c4_g1_i1.p1 TRINITY_DN2198_c4_g1~~TRINITY_DN2198_c4_g1_i1.p1  ORF type:complete len:480 (+),score=76.33 TRINITY_DN2198_c4_g1_i1:47-1441(+)